MFPNGIINHFLTFRALFLSVNIMLYFCLDFFKAFFFKLKIICHINLLFPLLPKYE